MFHAVNILQPCTLCILLEKVSCAPCSQHPAAVMHATARAVSGSSVYVSDFPGLHDLDLLKRLVLPDGRVLRATLPGRPTRDSLFCDVLRDNMSLLKARQPPTCTESSHPRGQFVDRMRLLVL